MGEESHKAGVQGRSSGDFEPGGSRYWSGRLRALFEQGVPAHEALETLRGAEGEPGRGRVGSEWRQFATRQELIEFLEPERAARPGRGVRGGRFSREAIDAVLRGEARPTPETDAMIRDLDAALSVESTPEPLLVSLGRARANLPEDLRPGTRVHEPAFLLTDLSNGSGSAQEGEVSVSLRVPSGIPALFMPSEIPLAPGTLMLARGLAWRVIRVVEGPDRTYVTGEIVSS